MLSYNPRKNMSFLEFLMSYVRNFQEPIMTFLSYNRAYKNPLHVIKGKLSKKYPINAVLKNGKTMIIENLFQLRLARWGAVNECNFQNGLLIINKEGFPEIKLQDWQENGDLRSVFFAEEYQFLPVKNKIVIDVGANIGDSPIYFALKGAEKVIALEPAPKNFESAKKNIELNGLSDKIDLIMAGCSNTKGNLQIDSNKSGITLTFRDKTEGGEQIPLIRLEDVLDLIDNKSCVLKMDCEGCEYETILSSSKETLQKFSHIQMEYHYGYKNLKIKLEECGFKVSVSKPILHGYHPEVNARAFTGFIYAERLYLTSG